MKHLVIALVIARASLAAADGRVDRVMANLPAKGPAAAYVVMHQGKLVAHGAYGLANIELGIAATPDQRYRIASISKQFTAVAIVQLAEGRRLDLDGSITKYLPNAPKEWAPITVAHLLTHTSGLISQQDVPQAMADSLNHTQTLAEFRKLFDTQAPHDKPGVRYAYNNWGYALLGQIIENLTHTPYCTYVTTKLLKPIDMTHTVCAPSGTIVPGLVTGYNFDYGRDLVTPHELVLGAAMVPAGGWVSNVDDLVAWATALHHGKLISQPSYTRLTTAVRLADNSTQPYGFGTRLRTIDSHDLVVANGDFPGFHSEIAFDRASDSVAVVLLASNASYPWFTRRMLAIARDQPIADPAVVHPATAELNRFVGRYEGTNQAPRRIELDHGALYSKEDGDPGRDELVAIGPATFRYVMDNDTRFVFTTARGKVVGVRIAIDGFPGEPPEQTRK